jgi:exopolysaccharide production protein ExoZ
MQKTKIEGVQIARAVAVLLVLLTHAIAHPYPAAPGVTHLLGRIGVTIFFVISGFLMAYITPRGPFQPWPFIRSRFLRVAPLYYAVNALTLAGVLFLPHAFKATEFDLKHITYSLAFLPMYSPGADQSITPFMKLGWTLNYELFFYVSFALLFVMSAAGRASVLFVVFGILVATGWLYPQTAATAVFYTDPGIIAFPVGVMLGTVSHRGALSSRWLQAAGLSAAVIFIYVALNYQQLRFAWWTQQLLIIASALVVLIFSSFPFTEKATPLRKLLAYIGDASYSIYLFHIFAVGLTYYIGRRLGIDNYMLLMPVAFIGGLLAGVVTYQLIEKPIIKAVKRSTRRKRPVDERVGLKAQPPHQN